MKLGHLVIIGYWVALSIVLIHVTALAFLIAAGVYGLPELLDRWGLLLSLPVLWLLYHTVYYSAKVAVKEE